MIAAAQTWHFSSFIITCFACFCCHGQGFLKVVQAWHVRDPLRQTGKYVKLCIYYIYYIKYISRNWSVFHCVFLGSVPNVGSCVASVAFKLQPGKHSKMLWRVIGKNAGLPRLLLSIPTWGVWKCHLKLHHFDEKYALLIGLDGICYWENSLALRLSVAVNSLRVCLFAIEHQI